MADLVVIRKYDDPIGFWYLCSECGKDIFLPDFDTHEKETELYKFCPYCGNKITDIKTEKDG